MSSREAARATTSTVSASAGGRDLQRLLVPPSGSFGKSSAGQDAEVEARAAAADLDVALGLAQLDLDLLVAERARELGEQAAGQQDRAGAVGLGLERRPQAHLEVGGREADRAVLEALRRIPDSAWVAARVETARETIESLETSSSRLVVSFN